MLIMFQLRYINVCSNKSMEIKSFCYSVILFLHSVCYAEEERIVDFLSFRNVLTNGMMLKPRNPYKNKLIDETQEEDEDDKNGRKSSENNTNQDEDGKKASEVKKAKSSAVVDGTCLVFILMLSGMVL